MIHMLLAVFVSLLTADIIVYVCCSIYADYYLEIKKPISLMKIQKKLKVCMYGDYTCEPARVG